MKIMFDYDAKAVIAALRHLFGTHAHLATATCCCC